MRRGIALALMLTGGALLNGCAESGDNGYDHAKELDELRHKVGDQVMR